MMNYFRDKTILITGAAGTVGTSLIKTLISLDEQPRNIIGIDNSEAGIFEAQNMFRDYAKVRLYLGDIRSLQAIERYFSNVDIVLHSAALKHVSLCELSPDEAILTNIVGTQNIIKAAKANSVGRVLFLSSDKAVNPTNVMGTSKLMAERLITAANAESPGTLFASTRFGNVLGSSGSVVPIFKNQILNGRKVTITDENMTRFVMSLEQATDLVLQSATRMIGGEVFITKMPVVKIADLADAMIEMLNCGASKIETEIIGTKPGEKLYEELMSDEETRRSFDANEFFVIYPAFGDLPNDHILSEKMTPVVRVYNSSKEDVMSINQIKKLLLEIGLIENINSSFTDRLW